MTPISSFKRHWYPAHSARSVEDREIIFYGSQVNLSGPLNTLLLAAFHGDEPESEQLLTHWMQTISEADVAGRAIGVILCVNPDGLAQNQRVNARGVDLNRNFPTADWAELNQNSSFYSGPAAASEPETRFLLEILDRYSPQKIISIHTPYRVINFDGPASPLAEAMAKQNHYPIVEDIGYATPGSFGIYVGRERNILTITLELAEKEAFTVAELHANTAALTAAIQF